MSIDCPFCRKSQNVAGSLDRVNFAVLEIIDQAKFQQEPKKAQAVESGEGGNDFLLEIFREFDTDGNGWITVAEVKKFLKESYGREVT